MGGDVLTKKVLRHIRERLDEHDVTFEDQDSRMGDFWEARREGERNCESIRGVSSIDRETSQRGAPLRPGGASGKVGAVERGVEEIRKDVASSAAEAVREGVRRLRPEVSERLREGDATALSEEVSRLEEAETTEFVYKPLRSLNGIVKVTVSGCISGWELKV